MTHWQTPQWIALAALLACRAAPSSQSENQDPEPASAPEVLGAITATEPSPAEPEPEPAPWQPRAEDRVTVHQPIENIEALTPFYERLGQIDDGERGLVRVVHLGASMIGKDGLTSVLRHKFQTRFGDGGAGLVLLQRYMTNYDHRWVTLEANGWKSCYIGYGCKDDRHYGLGGATFTADKHAVTKISTRDHALGGKVSRFELWYLASQRGGRFGIRIDGGEQKVIESRADGLEDRYHAIDVEPGPHEIEVRALGSGQSRGYGVVLETDGPGIVWDVFSMLGIFARSMRLWGPEHIAGQIAHRDPDLIAFTYGGNDVRRIALGKLSKNSYIKEYLTGVQRVRAGKPDASCIIISVIDRPRSLAYTIESKHMDTIIAGQREVARQAGCAFFDTYKAMGGGGSLRKWRKKNPPLAARDLKHLSAQGNLLVGGWIYDAIIAGYVAHRTDEP